MIVDPDRDQPGTFGSRPMKLIQARAFAALALLPLLCLAQIPEEGSPAPEFALADQNGDVRRLSEFAGQWVVLYFYPRDDTPGCTEEACKFRDDILELQTLGVQVLGCSVDSASSHAKFAAKHGLPFPLLADEDADVAQRYGAVTNLFVAKFAKRYTFLIDPKGMIAKRYLQVDTSRHSAQIIADVKELQASARQI